MYTYVPTNLCFVLPTEESSAEYEIFVEYYSQIVCCISAKTLSPHFVTENIISPAEEREICSVPSPIKAAGLLLSKVSLALNAGITKDFHKLLDIIEQYGNIDSKTVTTTIRKKLKCKSKGINAYTVSYIVVYH